MLRVTILMIYFLSVQSKELPPVLRNLRCYLKKDFEPCFIKNGNIAIPLVAEGIPDYHIPKMNPFVMPFVNLISTPSMSLNLTEVKVYGLNKLKVASGRLDWKQFTFTMIVRGQNVTLDGKYEALGQILQLPVKGRGHFSVFLKNGVYKFTNNATTIEKDGDKYIKHSDGHIDYSFEKIVFNFDNLFDGNKQLGDEVNRFLNSNSDILIIEFGPQVTQVISKILSNVLENLAEQIPIRNIFLDDPVST